MGADFLVAWCPLPVMSNGTLAAASEATAVLKRRIECLGGRDLEWANDITQDAFSSLEQMRGHLVSKLDLLFECPRDCTELRLEGRWVIHTGGMSTGDDPTGSYEAIRLLAESQITEEPIDGGQFVPTPLRAALRAYANHVGQRLDEAGVSKARRRLELRPPRLIRQMSAEFFYASCPLPITSDGNLASKEEAMPVLLERIDAMDEATLFEVADIYCGGMATDEETIEAVKGALASLFDESAECVDVVKSGRWVRESGGMSWGDSPTEAFDDLNLLASARITREPIDGGFFVPNPFARCDPGVHEVPRVEIGRGRP